VTPGSVSIPGELSGIQRAQEFLQAYCSSHGIGGDVLNDLALCLEEILTNVIKYGYDSPGPDHLIDVRIGLLDSELTIDVEDDGRPFNPLERPEPNLDLPIEERLIGGLGIYLVKKMTDGLEYERRENRNILRMRKRVA